MHWIFDRGLPNRQSGHCLTVVASGLLLLVVGCGGSGPELASVYGVVTLDGEPVEGKMVSFTPDSENQRSSVGITDEDGYYELYYTPQKKGALITTHIVTIATPEDQYNPRQKENIPKKYRINTELREVVKDGSQEINFSLTSK